MRNFKVKLELDGGWAFVVVTAINPEDATIRAEAKFTATHGLKAVAVEVEAA